METLFHEWDGNVSDVVMCKNFAVTTGPPRDRVLRGKDFCEQRMAPAISFGPGAEVTHTHMY